MTRYEAINQLNLGACLSHSSFTDDEYIYQKDGDIYDEKGNKLECFWSIRGGQIFNKNWKIFTPAFKKLCSLDMINAQVFEAAIKTVLVNGLEHFAPLGACGETIYVFCVASRVSQVSVRLHSAGVELLITDPYGNFLFYGKFYRKLGIKFIAQSFQNIFESVKEHIL